jgi:predicted secreted hydrolase
MTPKEVRLTQLNPTRGGFHYYLLPRLSASGTLTRLGGDLAVTGTAWLDRAWGAVPVSRGQVALNRFALQLADGRKVMCLHLRRRDGIGTPIPNCVLVHEDGSAVAFGRRDIVLEPTGHWSSPVDETEYPLAWRLAIPEEGLDLRIAPLLENQELILTLRLWSGAVSVEESSGTAGRGYMELTGYAG